MEWIERLNGTIAYIEEHLAEEIDYEALGRIACCSSYHYQRMFAYMAGMPLSEYIRRRRMSLAAVALQNGERVLDTALKYGYRSPTAFNRAFQAVHGITPSAAKEAGASVKTFPPLRFQITIKGAVEMEYRIEKREAFRTVGVSIPLAHEMEQNFAAVPQLWQKASANGTLSRLAALMNAQPMGMLGICACGAQEAWKYLIAAATSAPAEDGLEEYTVPACTWAVFPGEGRCPQAIQALEARIAADWLPTSGYEYADGPDIELYLSSDPEMGKFEVWIPVVKK